jgi:hypothetical protein
LSFAAQTHCTTKKREAAGDQVSFCVCAFAYRFKSVTVLLYAQQSSAEKKHSGEIAQKNIRVGKNA